MAEQNVRATRVCAGALVFVAERWRVFAKALAIPFVLYTAISIMFAYGATGWAVVALLAAFLALHTLFAVITHRLVLLGDAAVPEWGLTAWTKRESFFLIHIVLVGLCILPTLFLALVPGIGLVLTILSALWIFSRLSLVFPAIAIDQGVTIPLAWKLSRNHQAPLLLIVGVFPFVLGIPAMLLGLLPMTSIPVSILDMLMTVFTVAALSLAYREVRRLEFGT